MSRTLLRDISKILVDCKKQESQGFGVDEAVLQQFGFPTNGSGGGASPSWASGMSTYTMPPSSQIQSTVNRLTGSLNAALPGTDFATAGKEGDTGFNVSKYGGDAGGYVLERMYDNSGNRLETPRTFWIGENGQAKEMRNGEFNLDAQGLLQPNQQTPQFASQGQQFSQTGGQYNMPTLPQSGGGFNFGGGMGGMNPIQSTYAGGMQAINDLSTMLGDQTVQATTSSIRDRLSGDPFTDEMRAALQSNAMSRNATLRDRQLGDIQAKAGAAGVGAQDMSNSSVAMLNAELGGLQNQAELDAMMQQMGTNLGAEEMAAGQGLDWAALLEQRLGSQDDLYADLANIDRSNMWQWLLSRMGG